MGDAYDFCCARDRIVSSKRKNMVFQNSKEAKSWTVSCGEFELYIGK